MNETIRLYYRVTVTDREGRIKSRTRLRKSHSFVLQFVQMLEYLMRHGVAGSSVIVSVKDVGNTARDVTTAALASNKHFGFLAGDDISTYGIVVGTGTGAEANTDYKLGTQIAHGVGAGQLDYGAQSFTAAAVVGANVDLVLYRPFYNGSGNTITVNEIGMYHGSHDTSDTARYFCTVRDVVAATNVLNTETVTVQYTLRTTV